MQLGCFLDKKDDRDLSSFQGPDIAVDVCAKLCDEFRFFAMQYDSECWCGDDVGKHGAGTGCNFKGPNYGVGVNAVFVTRWPACYVGESCDLKVEDIAKTGKVHIQKDGCSASPGTFEGLKADVQPTKGEFTAAFGTIDASATAGLRAEVCLDQTRLGYVQLTHRPIQWTCMFGAPCILQLEEVNRVYNNPAVMSSHVA